MKILELAKQWIADQHMNWVDKGTIGATVLAFANWLPHLVTLLIVVWWSLRIWILVRDEILDTKKKKQKIEDD